MTEFVLMGGFIFFVSILFIAGMFFVPELFGISKSKQQKTESEENGKE